MRNPENVLISLTKHSNQKDYKYERLYRLLYNEELYLTAYQSIYSNDGSMTKGTDNQTVDGMSVERMVLCQEKVQIKYNQFSLFM